MTFLVDPGLRCSYELHPVCLACSSWMLWRVGLWLCARLASSRSQTVQCWAKCDWSKGALRALRRLCKCHAHHPCQRGGSTLHHPDGRPCCPLLVVVTILCNLCTVCGTPCCSLCCVSCLPLAAPCSGSALGLFWFEAASLVIFYVLAC